MNDREWIYCSDRLPELYVDVLATFLSLDGRRTWTSRAALEKTLFGGHHTELFRDHEGVGESVPPYPVGDHRDQSRRQFSAVVIAWMPMDPRPAPAPWPRQ